MWRVTIIFCHLPRSHMTAVLRKSIFRCIWKAAAGARRTTQSLHHSQQSLLCSNRLFTYANLPLKTKLVILETQNCHNNKLKERMTYKRPLRLLLLRNKRENWRLETVWITVGPWFRWYPVLLAYKQGKWGCVILSWNLKRINISLQRRKVWQKLQAKRNEKEKEICPSLILKDSRGLSWFMLMSHGFSVNAVIYASSSQ